MQLFQDFRFNKYHQVENMKRDMELIRKILMQLEESQTHDLPVQLDIEGYTPGEINHNVCLAWEGGLIKIYGKPIITLNSPTLYLPTRLTWEGYDFLNNSRNDNVWKKVIKVGKEKGGGLAFDVFKALLIQYAKEEFNILPH